jgi:uncharacterized RDD family membrane protein YckC
VLPTYVGEGSGSRAESGSDMESIHIPSGEFATEPIGDPSGSGDVEISTWRGELANRLEAYRCRRRKISPEAPVARGSSAPAQSRLPFAEPARVPANPPPQSLAQLPTASHLLAMSDPAAIAVEEPAFTRDDDFSFTIAIGRIATKPAVDDGRLMIDVSEQVQGDAAFAASDRTEVFRTSEVPRHLYPVASMTDRRLAALIDVACLLFACGGFLTLFGSLGGHFTWSKLNAAVSVAGLAIVYLQYFALFTIFGGTTPGMMFRGLQVMSFSGEAPTPRQMLLRSVGYLLSAGTFFMGFLWAIWDEDELTWHDRFSGTYLSSAQTFAEVESHTAAHPH